MYYGVIGLTVAYTKEKKLMKRLVWFVLLLQVVGLFYCGELENPQCEGNETCKALLCSILDSHDEIPFSQTFPQEDICHCSCSFIYTIKLVEQLPAFLTCGPIPEIHPILHIAAPPFDIDHIPRV